MHQNLMALEYLAGEFQTAVDAGGALELADTVGQLLQSWNATLGHQEYLQKNDLLPPDVFSDQFKAQKQLRRMYDSWMQGKKAFASQFGTSRERIESFDRKFEPNAGWKHFVEHS
ncbi:hypothetical protein HKCCSP123_01100 [Rhodobacterales bacterium HKCCSP123]|nr:hypothetical protein [Rhodobacterales bacterium HKCCSP123]